MSNPLVLQKKQSLLITITAISFFTLHRNHSDTSFHFYRNDSNLFSHFLPQSQQYQFSLSTAITAIPVFTFYHNHSNTSFHFLSNVTNGYFCALDSKILSLSNCFPACFANCSNKSSTVMSALCSPATSKTIVPASIISVLFPSSNA